jgi:hypothetical protein
LALVEQVDLNVHLVKEHQELTQYFMELHLLVVVAEVQMEVVQEQMEDLVVEEEHLEVEDQETLLQ